MLARLDDSVAEPPLGVRDDDGDGEGEGEEIIAARLASLTLPPPDQDGARESGREGKGAGSGGEARMGGALVVVVLLVVGGRRRRKESKRG